MGYELVESYPEMSKSQIVRFRRSFERSNQFNGNPSLESQLSRYKSRQEMQLLNLVPGSEMYCNVYDAIEEVGSMLESLRSRYSRSSQERI